MTIELGILLAILSGAISYAAFRRNTNNAIQQDATSNGELKADIRYIKNGVDDVRLEMKSQGKQLDHLAERVTRVEESCKSAHRRMDNYEGGIRNA